MAQFRIERLADRTDFGAQVTGLTVEMLDDPEIRETLQDLWVDKGVVVFKAMTGLDVQLRLSDIFGEPEEHPLLVGVKREEQRRTHHVIADIEFDREDGDLYEVKGELIGGYTPWHFDLAYVDRINRGAILRPGVLPRSGGETGFIDRAAAYDLLPEELKARIEGLSVLHGLVAMDSTKARFGERPERCLRLSSRIQRAYSHPLTQRRSIHPLVFTHEAIGRKVLNVSPWHALGIVGMENAEGDALLHEVINHALRPELAYYHRWEPNDMVLWDNWRMMHRAAGIPADQERTMRRTTIAGDYGLGRYETESAVPA